MRATPFRREYWGIICKLVNADFKGGVSHLQHAY